MKLTQDNLSNYFTIADNTNSWYEEPTNTFNFIDRNSKTLVVTVGDSWTWGCDLTKHDTDNEYRLQNVYGNQIAQKLNADWLNLALPSVGNFWIAERVEELSKIISELEYTRIYVICTFTETGRWFNTQYDLNIDYISWFKDNIKVKDDFYLLLKMFNQHCVSRIQSALTFNHVDLRIGTNMIEHIGFESLTSGQLLVKPWYQLVINGHDGVCAYMAIDGVKSILQAPEFLSDEHTALFKEWMIDIMSVADVRLRTLLENPGKFDRCHPDAYGHSQWAEYILSTL